MALNELPIPLSSQGADKAREILRVWINSTNDMDVTLLPAFAKPEMWGILLVDIARHAARSYEQDGEHSLQEALGLIRAGFDAEWHHPTDMGSTSKMHKQ